MRIVFTKPPLFDLIEPIFHTTGKGAIFCWGSTIYNPERIVVTPELLAHERVHKIRQGSDIEGWWRRYIAEPAFRLEEEIPAHRAEFRSFCERHKSAYDRAKYLCLCAKRLSSAQYGSIITDGQARIKIAGGS